MKKEIEIQTNKREEFIDITGLLEEKLEIEEGLFFVFVPHTTCAVTINEGADPSVQEDILRKLRELFPKEDNYKHSEGNSDAHLKTSLIGNSVLVLVENKKFKLGTWQKIFFCEFDGPRKRRIFFENLKIFK